PSLRIWPVPTRVELAEKLRLEAAQSLSRREFSRVFWQLNRQARDAYWSNIETLYFPFYAYEEILATVGDMPNQTNTLLRCMENLTGYVSANIEAGFAVSTLSTDSRLIADEAMRRQLLESYSSPLLASSGKEPARRVSIFISYANADLPAHVY